MSVHLIRSALRWGVPTLLGLGLLPPPVAGTPGSPMRWPLPDPGASAAPAPALATWTATAWAAMNVAGRPYREWAAQGRTFLAFDPGGDGRAVEAVGDLAAADRVIVLVPGVGARLADFDRGLGGVESRAPAWQARTLLAEAHRLDPAAHLAVVAWLGYDPPDGLGLDAARADSAASGADALVSFVAALAAIRPSVGVTVVGHSYGAVVVGRAAARLRRTTDLVALGAPGMGVARASDLGMPARVWAGQAREDWIRWIPGIHVLGLGHGRHPAAPGFGARALPVEGVRGHDGYLLPGSPTLRAVALIGLGHASGVYGGHDADGRHDVDRHDRVGGQVAR